MSTSSESFKSSLKLLDRDNSQHNIIFKFGEQYPRLPTRATDKISVNQVLDEFREFIKERIHSQLAEEGFNKDASREVVNVQSNSKKKDNIPGFKWNDVNQAALRFLNDEKSFKKDRRISRICRLHVALLYLAALDTYEIIWVNTRETPERVNDVIYQLAAVQRYRNSAKKDNIDGVDDPISLKYFSMVLTGVPRGHVFNQYHAHSKAATFQVQESLDTAPMRPTKREQEHIDNRAKQSAHCASPEVLRYRSNIKELAGRYESIIVGVVLNTFKKILEGLIRSELTEEGLGSADIQKVIALQSLCVTQRQAGNESMQYIYATTGFKWNDVNQAALRFLSINRNFNSEYQTQAALIFSNVEGDKNRLGIFITLLRDCQRIYTDEHVDGATEPDSPTCLSGIEGLFALVPLNIEVKIDLSKEIEIQFSRYVGDLLSTKTSSDLKSLAKKYHDNSYVPVSEQEHKKLTDGLQELKDELDWDSFCQYYINNIPDFDSDEGEAVKLKIMNNYFSETGEITRLVEPVRQAKINPGAILRDQTVSFPKDDRDTLPKNRKRGPQDSAVIDSSERKKPRFLPLFETEKRPKRKLSTIPNVEFVSIKKPRIAHTL